MVMSRNARGQGSGDGEIIVDRELFEIQNWMWERG